MRKRGQMEIIGIALVVILVSLGLLFMISFSLQRRESTIKQTYTHTEMASNVINTVLNTKVESCKGMLVAELLSECARMGDGALDCEDASFTPSGGYLWHNDTCTKAEAVIGFVLNSTLKVWQKPHHMYTSGLDMDFMYENCDKTNLEEGGWSNVESKTFILPLHPGVLTITLDICS